jgi:hypothetical protein
MKWERISCTPEQEVYQLYKDDQKILTLHFHPFSHSARVETGTEQRVFQIRKEGFLRNKTVLRTEYGIKIGELGHENGRAFISINNDKYFYSIQNNPLAELQIFKEHIGQPMITCGLKTDEGNPEVRFKRDKSQLENSNSSLLMALCWYMFLPVAKENTREMAV